MTTSSETRLCAVLGDDDTVDAATADWAQGFGIVSPDVARYVEVLRGVPDAVQLAMRNVAKGEQLELLDPDTVTLVALHARGMQPQRVLELGTGLGYLTLHLARAVPGSCTITSIDPDPIRQGQAHAFLERGDHECAVELRLGDPLQLLRDSTTAHAWNMVVLTEPSDARLDLIDAITERMAPGALLVVPWALRGGRVADAQHAWSGTHAAAEQQRLLNRRVAADPRFSDVTLLPVGDGLLLARRTG